MVLTAGFPRCVLERERPPLIADHLTRSSNFENRIPLFQVYRVEGVNASQVDDVLEVPAHEHVYPSRRRNRDMKDISPLVECPRVRAGMI